MSGDTATIWRTIKPHESCNIRDTEMPGHWSKLSRYELEVETFLCSTKKMFNRSRCIIKLYIISNCIVIVRGVSHLGLAKFVKCNQILGHVTDQNYVAFIDVQQDNKLV